MVPLVSSLCYGPLGYCQVPRTWWKSLLKSYGLLDPEYPPYSQMLDHWWMEGFGINDEEMLEYVTSEKPNYLDFEKWVEETARRKPNPVGQNSWNTLIETRVHRPIKFFSITEALGLKPETDLKSAVVLNNLEDWHYFYVRDLPEAPLLPGAAIPLISSLDYGRLGICQLPRTWLKVILEAKGLLHSDYPGCGDGLDAKVLKTLGLDRDATVEFLQSETPAYSVFESWVSEQNRGRINGEAVKEWNHFIRTREHLEEKRNSILDFLGLPNDGNMTSAVVLNHIEDLEYAYRELKFWAIP